jgi:glycosyltransferase involved in cell wall biosynthesis
VLEHATIAVFADDWGAHPSSAQHLFRRFLGRNRVVWFNTVGQRLPRPTLADAKKALRKISYWTGLARPPVEAVPAATEPRPEVADLPLVPLPLGAVARAANARLLARAVQARLAGGASDKYIVSTLPLTADLAGAVPDATFVYYVVDDYASWPGIGGPLLRRMDAHQARGADLVVAASQALVEAQRRHARRSIAYLPHGVDVDHFAVARRARDERRARGEAPAAHVVFFGAIDERIDQRLLLAVAAARPGLRFLIVGPSAALGPALRRAPNVALRDAVPYADLPRVLAACEATILPYVGGPLGERLSPLKAREALAAGLPVVATAVPELRSLGRGVLIGETVEELCAAVDRALAGDEPPPSLDDLARDSWDARAERLSDLLAGAREARAGR